MQSELFQGLRKNAERVELIRNTEKAGEEAARALLKLTELLWNLQKEQPKELERMFGYLNALGLAFSREQLERYIISFDSFVQKMGGELPDIKLRDIYHYFQEWYSFKSSLVD